ncbi:MAG: D-glycerate dehydrogenase, partial [Thermoplasmata archaeon]
FEVKVHREERPLTSGEIRENAQGCFGIISLLSDPIDKEVLSIDSLKAVCQYAVGYDNIDVAEATRRGILITNTPGVLTETCADYTFALILALSRRILDADRFTREGKFRGWSPTLFLGKDVYGKTLGIIGLGRIGKAVARRAFGFSMKVLAYDERIDHDFVKSFGIEVVSVEEIFARSDFISLHVPGGRKTYHIVNEKTLSLMKKTAYLINIARGTCVDEKALAKALKQGIIAGAALDVYEKEPAIDEEILTAPNTLLLPHIASASVETRTRMAIMCCSDMVNAFEGKPVENPVNPEVLTNRVLKWQTV